MAVRSGNSSKGETRIGTSRGQNIVYLPSGKKSGGTIFAMDAVNAAGVRTTVYFWVSSDGKLRSGAAIPADTEAGTVVGTQT